MVGVALKTTLIHALLEHHFVIILGITYQVGVAAYTTVGHVLAGERVSVASGALVAELGVRGYTAQGHSFGLGI